MGIAPMHKTNMPDRSIILGDAGTGKTLLCLQRLVNNLVEGNSAVVFDCGRAYYHLVRAMGGTLVTADQEKFTVARCGPLCLTVYDLEDATSGLDIANLPSLPGLDANTFVLIDDLWEVNRVLPGVGDWLKQGSEFGFCGLMRRADDVDLSNFPADIQIQRIENLRSKQKLAKKTSN